MILWIVSGTSDKSHHRMIPWILSRIGDKDISEERLLEYNETVVTLHAEGVAGYLVACFLIFVAC